MIQETVILPKISRHRGRETRLPVMALPFLLSIALVGTLLSRDGRAIAQNDPPLTSGTVGFIDGAHDRYLLLQLDQSHADYGAFLIAIPGIGLLAPTTTSQVTILGTTQVTLIYNGTGLRNANAIIDAELTLNTRSSGQSVPITFQIAATLNPVEHTGNAQVTYDGQIYTLDFVTPPHTADGVLVQLVAALQQQDSAQVYALADRQLRGALTQTAFVTWFNSDFASLGTITSASTLRQSLYTVETYGYHSASAVLALTTQATGTRWLEVLLINDGGSWRFSSFVPLPLDQLLAVAGGPYTVSEGQSVAIAATPFNPTNATLAYAWDLDNDGSFETSGQSVSFAAAALDGPATRTIRVRATASGGASAVGQTTVAVTNAAPVATFAAPGSVVAGQGFTLGLNNPQDVAADRPTLQYAFDCGDGAGYGAFGSAASRACATSVGQTGSRAVKGTVRDKDGGATAYAATVTLTATAPVQVVRPILECVADNGNGTFTAYFGYKNDWNAPITVPVGASNKFTPNPQGRGQPTTFQPGRTPYYPNAAFSVVFDGNNLVWTLKSPDGSTRTSTASRNSTRCAP